MPHKKNERREALEKTALRSNLGFSDVFTEQRDARRRAAGTARATRVRAAAQG
ncbi:hypothetical protein BURPS668_A3140 [Burkholderia pseudomallei 668]|nr:hypothetical protein BURPS668_A3140 [Burkholderia pseudomallei 668]